MPILSAMLTWPLRRPAMAIAVMLLLAMLAALGSSRIHADASLQAMFARDNASAEALVRVMNDFGAADELLVLISNPGTQEATPQEVDRLVQFGDRLVDELNSSRESAAGKRFTIGPKVAELTEGAFDRPDAEFRKFIEQVLIPSAVYYLDAPAFAAVQDRLTKLKMTEQIHQDETMMAAPGAAGGLAKALMRDPLRLRDFLAMFLHGMEAQRPFTGRPGTEAFVSPDGRNLLVRVRGNQSPSNLDYCKRLTEGVARVAADLNSDHFELRYAGSYAIAAASATAIRSDMISSVVGSVLCLQLLFLLAYRSAFKLFALAFGPIALGILLGFGGYSLFTTGLTPMTAVLGGILAGMAIDYSVQYLSLYESRRDAGKTPGQSAEASATGITPAAFAAWATSVVGFLAIGFSSVKALRDFSLLGSLGLGGAFLAAVVLLPMILMLTDRRKAGIIQSRFRFGMEPLLRWIGRHSRAAISISILIFLCAAAYLVIRRGELLPMETDLTVMHPRPNPAIDAQNLITRRFGMHEWLIVHLHAQSPEELVALAHRVNQKLDGEAGKAAGVTGSFGLASLLPDPAILPSRQAVMGVVKADRVVADFQSVINDSAFNPDAVEIRDYQTFLKVALTRPPPTMASLLPYRRLAELMLPRTAFDGKPVTEAITLVFITGSTNERASRDSAVDGLRNALAGEMGATVTGLDVISRDTERTVRRDLPRLSLVAIVVVLIYLLVHFRNLADAMLAITPTIFSLTILLAVMRLVDQKVNMINLIAAPLLIGIDVDYGIFLVSLARVRRTRSQTVSELIARIAPVSHAVLICAVATTIGYGSLMWTSVPAIRSLGFTVGMGIVACLFCVLFLLVPIFLRLAQRDAVSPDVAGVQKS